MLNNYDRRTKLNWTEKTETAWEILNKLFTHALSYYFGQHQRFTYTLMPVIMDWIGTEDSIQRIQDILRQKPQTCADMDVQATTFNPLQRTGGRVCSTLCASIRCSGLTHVAWTSTS